MHKRLRDDDADVSPSTRDGDAAAPREAKRTSVPLLAIAARADAVPTDVERVRCSGLRRARCQKA